MDTIIELTHVSKFFTKNKPILHQINLSVHSNQCLAILGHNGSGKSTLLKLLAGLIQPSQGMITHRSVNGIGYAPEHFPRIRFTAEEYLYVMGRLQKIPKAQLTSRIRELLEIYTLKESFPISNYSKGMAQKVNLIQAILGEPDILILDEPLSGLDAASQLELTHMLESFKKVGMTIIVTCHEATLLDPIADRVLVLQDGAIVSDSPYQKKSRLFKVVFSSPRDGIESKDDVISWCPPGAVEYVGSHNELYVKEENRDQVLYELLSRKCSIYSVNQESVPFERMNLIHKQGVV